MKNNMILAIRSHLKVERVSLGSRDGEKHRLIGLSNTISVPTEEDLCIQECITPGDMHTSEKTGNILKP